MAKRASMPHPRTEALEGASWAKQGANVSLSERLAEAAVARRRGDAPNAEVAEHWSAAEPGVPAPCHACGGPGFLDVIDVRRHRQHEHCKLCGVSWVRPI